MPANCNRSTEPSWTEPASVMGVGGSTWRQSTAPLITAEDFWHGIASLTYANEAEVETKLLAPLLDQLGYERNIHIAWKYKVIFRSGTKGRKHEADIAVFSGKPHGRDTSLIAIEAKAPGKALDDGKEQGESYAAHLKAPLLVMCNGVRFEIWQLQPTLTSELVFECAVPDLPARRSEVERLLSMPAVVAYAKSLTHKPLKLVLEDLSAYEDAEYQRSRQYPFISRRARNGQREDFDIEAIASHLESGVVVYAPSGYGKTRLADHLTARAIENRISGIDTRLPVLVFLPDAPTERQAFQDFLTDRVAAHCPHFVRAAAVALMKEHGVTIIGDGFDRVPLGDRVALESTLALTCRDYPKTRLQILSRPHHRLQRLEVTEVELLPLNDEEQFELSRTALGSKHAARRFIQDGTAFLKSLWPHPLLLDLTLEHYRASGEMPTRIETLFESWIDRLLPRSMPSVRRLRLRDLLTLVAEATTAAPLPVAALMKLAHDSSFEERDLEELFSNDALFSRDGGVELQHEALSDYLRAAALLRSPVPEIIASLRPETLVADSNYPPLLMALASSAELQAAIWARIVAVDLKASMIALRYRADVSSSYMGANGADICLSGILAGIEQPLQRHLPNIADRVREQLAGPDVNLLGIRGDLESNTEQLTYEFFARTGEEAAVQTSALSQNGILHGKWLGGMGYRVDSGALIGMTHLRDGLIALLDACRLDGGLLWAEERTAMRLLDLKGRYRLDWKPRASLKDLHQMLKPYSARWIGDSGLIGRRPYPMKELLNDLDLLIQGRVSLEKRLCTRPPTEHDLKADPEGLRALLVEHFERTQLLVKEVVEASFAELANHFPHFCAMPLRFDVVVQHDVDQYGDYSPNTQYTWMPVADWSQAGAGVVFAEKLADLREVDPWPSAMKALGRLGRNIAGPSFSMGTSFSLWSYLSGSAGHGDDRHASSALRAAKEALRTDIKMLFAELPDRDRVPDRVRK